MSTSPHEALEALAARLRVNPYWLHWPHPRQAVFLLADDLEVLYGGAAGGGKSDALLMAALQYVDQPGYHAVIFRREYPQLAAQGGLIPRAHEWLDNTDAEWIAGDKLWRFPSGATLAFRHLARADSHRAHQGAEYAFVGFDELTHFEEAQYLGLLSRLRAPEGATFPMRARATTNPGGPGHAWVKARFVDAASRAPTARFVPASLADNPSLGADYRARLELLHPIERARLLHGDWDAVVGDIFAASWFKVIDPDRVPRHLKWVRFWDLAASESTKRDRTATVRLAIDKATGRIYIADGLAGRWKWPDTRRIFAEVAAMDGAGVKQHVEAIGSWRTVVDDLLTVDDLRGVSIKGVTYDRGHADKVSRALPLAARAEQGLVYLVNGAWCADFVGELSVFPDAKHDDFVDAASGAYYVCHQRKPGLGVFKGAIGR